MNGVLPSSPLGRTVGGLTAIAMVCLAFADIEISTADPWGELGRLAAAILRPDFTATEDLGFALARTVAFALVGVAVGNAAGFALALVFRHRAATAFCAVIRAVHELFWALIFLQIFGLSTLTGVLAIAIPYAGIFAKVYAEILEEADPGPARALPEGTGRLSTFLFARLPLVLAQFRSYSLYRLECGLRSSAVLGFVGLPTLGFHLESAFNEGRYAEVWALLLLFYAVIATLRLWLRRRLIPLYLLSALIFLPWEMQVSGSNILRFLTEDIVPFPLRAADTFDATALSGLANWLDVVLFGQALPGLVATLQFSLIALAATGIVAFACFPAISPLFLDRVGRGIGHLCLVVMRSTPEYLLAYILLQLWGPSMLPAIVALSLHNGAIIGHLIGRHTETLRLRADASHGINRYVYEVAPRIYRPLLAFLFYRFEVILRETAILGMLGIATLGFYIDSAFADLRFDRATLLIAVTAGLNIAVDAMFRALRARLRLQTSLVSG